MDAQRISVAQNCLAGNYADSMSFPASVMALMAAGFDGYYVDYRANSRTCYSSEGEALVLANPHEVAPVAALFDAQGIAAAVQWAQSGAADYSYAAFNERVAAHGCASYLVSFCGRRVVYFGRTGELHVEHFPS